MESWRKRLLHDRAVRDALVACGNPAPDKPDPTDGLYTVRPRKYSASVFWPFMRERGHSASEFEDCDCNKVIR